VSDRTIVQPNTLWASAGKALGLGEKRDRLWWYSAEEIEAVRGEMERRRLAKQECSAERKAARLARYAAAAQPSPVSFQASAPVPATWPPKRTVPRPPAARLREFTPRAPARKFHTMPFIEDPSLFKAVKFALAMRAKGTSTPLACHRAARYYRVRIGDVARELGRMGARKALKNRVWGAYQEGRRGES
jgi:hypothetical protein